MSNHTEPRSGRSFTASGEGGSQSAGEVQARKERPVTEPRWRDEVLDPATMTDADIRAELRHDLDVYDRVRHPLSKAGMGRRIEVLVAELDRRLA